VSFEQGPPARLRFDVADTGVGMSAEQLERVRRFDAFSQADSSTTRKYGGTGLGLRISAALAKLLGGELSVDSEAGRGSTFSLTIDPGDVRGAAMTPPQSGVFLGEAPAVPAADQTASNPMPLQGVRVLLAEDGVDNQRLIMLHLKKSGAEAELAENGLVAVERVREAAGAGRAFDLVLMDMQMPELDGYAATARLRDLGFRLPIVALTAHAMDGDRGKCLDAGCDEYLTKPIKREVLIESCRRWALDAAGRADGRSAA